MTRRILPSWGEWLVIIGISSVLFFVLYPAVQMARNPKGPHGKIIPTVPPEESRRVAHHTGLSIVVPINWDVVRSSLPGDLTELRIAARGSPVARGTSIISISEHPPPHDRVPSDCVPVVFQQYPAHERMSVLRHSSFDDPASSRYDLYVDRDGQWWRIYVLLAGAFTTLPDELREYVETIRFPEPDPEGQTTNVVEE